MNISFEFFPPRNTEAQQKLSIVRDELLQLHPEYFSITFGAGGTTQESTFNTIKSFLDADIIAVPHLSCIGSEKNKILNLLTAYKEIGVNKILALRGDIPSGMREIGDFQHGSDLVAFIRENFNDYFKITVAAYPEKHPQAKNYDTDFTYFLNKLKLADNAITQYFYNIDSFLYFRDEVSKRSDKIIIPGIMPITNFENLVRFSKMCGAEIPRWIYEKLASFDSSKDLQQFGFEVVNNLCQNLKKEGVSDFHFYSMNKTYPSMELAKNLI